jgi:hypothetical protein
LRLEESGVRFCDAPLKKRASRPGHEIASGIRELRQDAAIPRRKCPKFADDFAAKSADNAAKFPARDRWGFHSQAHREDHP